jgi:hypothetical protein
MAENTELNNSQNIVERSAEPVNEPQISRKQRIIGKIKQLFSRKPKVDVLGKEISRKNQLKTLEGQPMNYDQAQAKLFEDRLAESRQDYQAILNELIQDMKPEKAQIFQDKFDQTDPVLMKTLTLYLLDKYNFGTAQRNIQIKNINRELTNQSYKKGEESGKDHLPMVDLAEKSAKVALYKNLNSSFDIQLRAMMDGKDDKRADVAFANKDLNIALRTEPLFVKPKPESEKMEPFIFNNKSDNDFLQTVASGEVSKKE